MTQATTPPERHCAECGQPYAPGKAFGLFCCTACRAAFHNRRRARGAELYDLFMALRHDRKASTVLGVWSFMCRLAMYWREQDTRERAARQSWLPPHVTMERNSWAHAMVVYRPKAGRR